MDFKLPAHVINLNFSEKIEASMAYIVQIREGRASKSNFAT